MTTKRPNTSTTRSDTPGPKPGETLKAYRRRLEAHRRSSETRK